MTEIVGVGFVKASKTYYFDPEGKEYKMGELVIVETARGLEMGHISIENREVEDSEIVAPLKKIERRATKADLAKYRENLNKRESAMKVCEEKIRKHKLEMKLVDAEYTIDGSKVIFYFSAEGRIDFRELVKDLAAHFRMRNGPVAIEVKCADDEPTKACIEAASQLIDKVSLIPERPAR